jgi:outer membrane protein OmpA-like peptidoglycan-associated protein
VTIALNPPGGGQVVGANAEYLTYGTVTVPTIDPETHFANDVFFAYNSAVLLPEAMPIIEQYAAAMRESETMRLEVQGHTDSVGTEAYNDTLSIARAEAVREAFISMGISGDRIRARGFGESRPTDTNGTEDGRRRNRRTEFIILRR